MINFTNLLVAVLDILGVVLSAYFIPWLKSKTSQAQQEKISALVKTGVYAAEQLFGSGEGKQKFDYACDYLKLNGIDVTDDRIKSLIESMVKQLTLEQSVG